MSFEDMGIVRGLAHSVVLEVTDAVMFADILRQLMDLDGFYWLRTIRKQARSIYAPMSFEDMGIVRGLAHSVVLEVTDAVMFADILRQL
ncbi:transketolase family protein, partial [Salmonella enterica]